MLQQTPFLPISSKLCFWKISFAPGWLRQVKGKKGTTLICIPSSVTFISHDTLMFILKQKSLAGLERCWELCDYAGATLAMTVSMPVYEYCIVLGTVYLFGYVNVVCYSLRSTWGEAALVAEEDEKKGILHKRHVSCMHHACISLW